MEMTGSPYALGLKQPNEQKSRLQNNDNNMIKRNSTIEVTTEKDTLIYISNKDSNKMDEIDPKKFIAFEHPLLPEWWKSDKLWRYLELHYNIIRDGIVDDADLPLLRIVSKGVRLRDWR